MGMLIITPGKAFLTQVNNQQFRGQSLFVIECHIHPVHLTFRSYKITIRNTQQRKLPSDHCFRTCWLREIGLIDREDKRWFYHKPKCETAGQNFVSVGIQEFYPVLVVLAYGIVGSVGVLIIEILFFKRQQINCALDFTNNVTVMHKDGN